MKTDPSFWILSRATGLTAYVLLTAVVVAGLVLKARPFGPALRPAAVTDVHRFLSLLSLGFVAAHGITLVLDQAVPIPIKALFVPGSSVYRPLWTGVGVVAAELVALVIASFWLRRRIGTKNWRRLHWATYAIFAGATAHGIGAGTDSRQTWALGLYLGAIAAVTGATAWRVLVPPARPVRQPRPDIEKGAVS